MDYVEVLRKDAEIYNNRAVCNDGRQDCLEKPCDCSPVGDLIIIIIIL